MLEQLASDLWVVAQPQRFYGLAVGKRMTVIRLSGGRLLLHSPVALDFSLRAELDGLGTVRYAVAPNRFHHQHAGDVLKLYPQARLWVAPSVEQKRPDLEIAGVLGDDAPEEWRGEVEQTHFRGRPFENEVAFFHKASRTLILSDLAFNFSPELKGPSGLFMRLMMAGRRFGPTRIDWMLIRNRQAARQSLERILAWDFDRVIVAHGDVLETGGNDALRRGYHWLLR